MFKFPLLIVYAVIAFNVSAFAILLQMDMLTFQSTIAKLAAWAFTAGAWGITYLNRNKFYTFKFK